MGWNTTLMLVNDAVGEIDKDPAGWWAEVRKHHLDAQVRPQEFGFGHHGNGFWVVTNDHADFTNVIAVGGNYATVLGRVHTGNGGHHEEEDVRRILREIQAGGR